ncbi:tetratricopeptide repeat protein, partial [Nocardia salmonicida]|uniref:caspase family protein n=1 Tax=Nocardia salmonicida TaxID=53431 RepID=UPI0037A9DD81
MTTRQPRREHSHAVLIGVGAYDHSERLPPIAAAAHNLSDLSRLLTSDGGVLSPDNCWTVLNPDSSARVGDLVERASEQATDTLLVYYTGHGLLDRRGRLHLTLTGTHPDRTGYTALPFSTLRESILDSPAATRILILDCCFSGRAFDALTDAGPDAILGQADIAGTYTITSSARNELSYAPPGDRNTAFTGALIAAATHTPGLALDDLYTHTEQHLHRNGHPRPQRRAVNTAGRLILFPRTTPHPSAGTISELEKTLADRQRVLGPDHVDTLNAAHNLAYTYAEAGRADEAIDLFEKTLIDRQRVLGPDHVDTLNTAHNLAYTYREAGRFDEAIDLFEKTLADQQRVLGPDHVDTLNTAHNLAYTYAEAGRAEEVIDLFEKTLADQQRVLGPDHADTLNTAHDLA